MKKLIIFFFILVIVLMIFGSLNVFVDLLDEEVVFFEEE